MKILGFPQGSQEWKQARCGLVTASRIPDVMAKIKTGEAASRRDYKAQIVAEILTGQPQDDTFQNAAMTWGTETEPLARAAYEIATGRMVDTVGLVMHPDILRGAASPDGLVGLDGLLEIKCPKTATHLLYLTERQIPKDYQLQMLWQMACTERAWCDFVSFDPRMPEHLQLLTLPFKRDETRIDEITQEVDTFLAEVEAIVERLAAIYA